MERNRMEFRQERNGNGKGAERNEETGKHLKRNGNEDKEQ